MYHVDGINVVGKTIIIMIKIYVRNEPLSIIRYIRYIKSNTKVVLFFSSKAVFRCNLKESWIRNQFHVHILRYLHMQVSGIFLLHQISITIDF